jgi:hypothetical protein
MTWQMPVMQPAEVRRSLVFPGDFPPSSGWPFATFTAGQNIAPPKYGLRQQNLNKAARLKQLTLLSAVRKFLGKAGLLSVWSRAPPEKGGQKGGVLQGPVFGQGVT